MLTEPILAETVAGIQRTLGAELEAAGYDADFAELPPDGTPAFRAVLPRTHQPVRLNGFATLGQNSIFC